MVRTTVRVVLIAAAMLAGFCPAPSASAADTIAYREVKLRKLHLVRPDLIPYPIAYEVVC